MRLRRLGVMFKPMPELLSDGTSVVSNINTYSAICCFWQTQILSDSALTRSRKRLRATKRPGLPMMCGCKASVIILGLPFLPSATRTFRALLRCSKKSSGPEKPGASTNL